MCKWSATLLTTSQCKDFYKPSGPHQYQEREIWPCRHAKKISSGKWEPCENYIGKDGGIVRQSTLEYAECPVCRAMEEANEAYLETLRAAEDRYRRAMEKSTVFTRFVSLCGGTFEMKVANEL